ADLLALSHHASFRRDVVVTRGSNTYGPRQHPEKLLPTAILCAERREPVPLYGDGMQVRDWIHVADHAAGVLAAARRGRSGEVYHLPGGCERTNRALIETLLRTMGRDESMTASVPDRPGHDRRYAMDGTKARHE